MMFVTMGRVFNSETGRTWFRRARFQTLSSVSFWSSPSSGVRTQRVPLSLLSVDRQKGHVKKIVKKCQKDFSTLIDHFRAGQISSKGCQTYLLTLFNNFRAAPVLRPTLGGALILFVGQSELTEILAELTEFAAELSEFSPPRLCCA